MKRRRVVFPWQRKPTLMDRVEEWLPDEIAARIPEQVEKALRKRLDGIDLDRLEAQLGDRLGRLDRTKVEELLQAGLEAVQAKRVGKEVASAREHLPSRRELEAAIRERIDTILPERIEQALRSRASAVKQVMPEPAAVRQAVKQAIPEAAVMQQVAKQAAVKVAKPGGNPVSTLLGAGARMAFLSAGAWIAYSTFMIDHQVVLTKAIAADQTTLAYRPTGPLCLYRDTSASGRPVLLVHSVNAAASSFEMRPLFERFRKQRPTYALDLPGFGFSARPELAYAPATFVQAILRAVETIVEEHGGTSVDIVALSLGSEFAAEAARQRHDLIRSLALISPSGMRDKPASGMDQWLYPAFSFKLWARPFFDLLTTKRSIRYFLQRSLVTAPPQEMVDYAYATAHQPDAEHAPLAFVSGRLFTPNAVDRIYRKVEQPVLVLHDEDAFVSFERLPELVARENWQAARVAPTLGLPQWEKPDETHQLIAKFFAKLD